MKPKPKSRKEITKQQTVIVKVEEKMKLDLAKLAKENNREFSDFIRQVFQKAIDAKIKI